MIEKIKTQLQKEEGEEDKEDDEDNDIQESETIEKGI